MATIKDLYFHIKGTPDKTATEREIKEDNYVWASLYYTKGEGYFWRIDTEKQYTWYDDHTGESIVMRAYTLGRDKNWICEKLVPCKRQGKAKQKEAEVLFDAAVVAVITYRLGYEIDKEGCD